MTDRSIEVRWQAPTSTGAPINRYDLEWARIGEGAAVERRSLGGASLATETTITNLPASARHRFRVRAANADGVSGWSPWAEEATVGPPDAPQRPTFGTVTGDSIQVVWQAPADNGLPLTAYQVQHRAKGEAAWRLVIVSASNGVLPTTTTVANLTPSTAYEFRVRAATAAGSSLLWSPVASRSTLFPPHLPLAPTVTGVTSDGVTASWIPPADNGSPIIRYGYRLLRVVNGEAGQQVAGGETAATSVQIAWRNPSATENQAVEVQVRAFNGAGWSPWSPGRRASRPPARVPDAPAGVEFGAVTQTSIEITGWDVPADNGKPITSYLMTMQKLPPERPGLSFRAGTGVYKPLEMNTEYRFRIAAVNDNGQGEWSPWRSKRTLAATVPDAPPEPTFGEVTGSTVELRWEAPADNGRPITKYLIRHREENGSWLTQGFWGSTVLTDRSIVFPHFQRSRRYEFQVRVSNGDPDIFPTVDLGPWSPVATVVTHPNAPRPPAAPTFGQITANSIEVIWTEPDGRGRQIGGYFLHHREVGETDFQSTSLLGSGTTATITGLDADTRYEFRVRAVGSGTGPPSPWREAKTAGPPSPLAAPTFGQKTRTSIEVIWTPPDDDGGSPIQGYLLRSGRANPFQSRPDIQVPAAETRTVVTGLEQGIDYTFSLSVFNAAGLVSQSPWREAKTAEPPAAPAAPTFGQKTKTSVEVFWTPPPDDGGAPINTYSLRYRPKGQAAGGESRFFPASQTRATVTGLAPNTRYQFTVGASNGAALTGPASPVSEVRTEGNRAPAFRQAGYRFTLAENASGGSGTGVPLGTVAATDADASDTMRYTITAGNGAGLFAIDETSGAITYVGPGEDFEGLADPDDAYTLMVRASDGTSHDEATVTVGLTDVNEAPVFTGAAAFTVPERSRSAGTVAAVDPDAADGGVSFSLSPGRADNDRFLLDQGGALRFASHPDFEQPGDGDLDNEYEVLIGAASGAGQRRKFVERRYTVTVTDLTAPAAPAAPSFGTRTDESLAVEWQAPGDDGGVPVTGYGLRYRTAATGDSSAGPWSPWSHTGTGTAATITALVPATAYEVQVHAVNGEGASVWSASGTGTTTGTANHSPAFAAASYRFTLAENTAGSPTPVALGTVVARDPDVGDTVRYTITTGNGAGLFAIDETSGALTYIGPGEDYEALTDPLFLLTVRASDGADHDEAPVTVAVTNANEAPVFSGDAAFSVVEGITAVGAVAATDPDTTDRVTGYGLGGADAAQFTISGTGALAFRSPSDFESRTSTAGTNTYAVTVTATGGSGDRALSSERAYTVTVMDVNEAPAFASPATVLRVPENTTAVGMPLLPDPDDATTYALSGGADAAAFTITADGALSFQSAPDFESPGSDAGTNAYAVEVEATGGTGDRARSARRLYTVEVEDVNEPPFLGDLNRVPAPTMLTVAENQTTVIGRTEFGVWDPDAEDSTGRLRAGVTFITGADAALFNGVSGSALSFRNPPDFENPRDHNTDNVYEVTFLLQSGGDPSSGRSMRSEHTFMVEVTDVNEAPVFVSPTTVLQVPENTTAVGATTADPDAGDATTYELSGADAAAFMIASDGALSFRSVPDFERPGSTAGTNTYAVTVTATSGVGDRALSVERDYTVMVTNVNEPPAFASPATVLQVPENTTAVGTPLLPDLDAGDATTYALTGTDASQFMIAADGALSFQSAPNFESPGSTAGTNTYAVTVTATGGSGDRAMGAERDYTVQVTNVNELPSVPAAPTLAPAGADSIEVRWTAPATTGPPIMSYAVRYRPVPPDSIFIEPLWEFRTLGLTLATTIGGLQANTAYEVQISAHNGEAPSEWSPSATLDLRNVPPVFAGPATVLPVPENTKTVGTPVLPDPDAGDATTWTLSGADQAAFMIESDGVLSFRSAPDFERPGSNAGTNAYAVTVTATGGSGDRALSVERDYTVEVTNANEPPVFASPATVLQVPENTTAVGTPVLPDPDVGDATTYTLSGADQAAFMIESDGVLSFRSAPDFERPVSNTGTKAYAVTVTATGGSGDRALSVERDYTVTVTNVNEPPSAPAAPTLAQAGVDSIEVRWSEPATTGPPVTGYLVRYRIAAVGTAPARLYDVETFHGTDTTATITDLQEEAVYEVQVGAFNADGNGDFSPLATIDIGNVAPVFTGSTVLSAAENQTSVGTVEAVDPNGDAVTYRISGGADAAAFTITSDGALSFQRAPNFESPGSDAGTNTYEVEVEATGGTGGERAKSARRVYTVRVTDANEPPAFVFNLPPTIATDPDEELSDLIGFVTATDPDADDTVTYSLSGADMALFEVGKGGRARRTALAHQSRLREPAGPGPRQHLPGEDHRHRRDRRPCAEHRHGRHPDGDGPQRAAGLHGLRHAVGSGEPDECGHGGGGEPGCRRRRDLNTQRRRRGSVHNRARRHPELPERARLREPRQRECLQPLRTDRDRHGRDWRPHQERRAGLHGDGDGRGRGASRSRCANP